LRAPAVIVLKMLDFTGVCEPLLWSALGDQSCPRNVVFY